jgi:hypothetical protein
MGLVHHCDRAGHAGRDERASADARRGEDQVSSGVGAGEGTSNPSGIALESAASRAPRSSGSRSPHIALGGPELSDVGAVVLGAVEI